MMDSWIPVVVIFNSFEIHMQLWFVHINFEMQFCKNKTIVENVGFWPYSKFEFILGLQSSLNFIENPS